MLGAGAGVAGAGNSGWLGTPVGAAAAGADAKDGVAPRELSLTPVCRGSCWPAPAPGASVTVELTGCSSDCSRSRENTNKR